MSPTLRNGDLLEIVLYGDRDVRAGDVVLFASPADLHPVVHRVSGVTPRGIRTRGDNCRLEDAWIVRPEDIQGRVIAAWRGARRRSIPGGRVGSLYARWIPVRGTLDRFFARLLYPLYRAAARQINLMHWLPASLKPRVLVLETHGQKQALLVLGKNPIGYFDSASGEWIIRRPFRLLVDEGVLGQVPQRHPNLQAKSMNGQDPFSIS